MEWSFHYEGPAREEDNRLCPTCTAKAVKRCHTHGETFAVGCAHCQAAQGAPCRAHWGLAAALDGHVVEDGAQTDWAAAKSMVLAEMEARSGATLARIDLRGSALENRGAVHREFVINIFLR